MKRFNLSALLIIVTLMPLAGFSQRSAVTTHAAGRVDSIRQKIRTYYQLGLKYKEGKDRPIDYQKSLSYFRRAAALGDPQSQYAVAYYYYKGLSGEQSYEKAAALFRLGAYNGRENSQYFLGLLLRNGYGVRV